MPSSSSLFTSRVSLNSTASNTSVPWGLWSLPTSLDTLSLPTLPDVAAIGRSAISLIV